MAGDMADKRTGIPVKQEGNKRVVEIPDDVPDSAVESFLSGLYEYVSMSPTERMKHNNSAEIAMGDARAAFGVSQPTGRGPANSSTPGPSAKPSPAPGKNTPTLDPGPYTPPGNTVLERRVIPEEAARRDAPASKPSASPAGPKAVGNIIQDGGGWSYQVLSDGRIRIVTAPPEHARAKGDIYSEKDTDSKHAAIWQAIANNKDLKPKMSAEQRKALGPKQELRDLPAGKDVRDEFPGLNTSKPEEASSPEQAPERPKPFAKARENIRKAVWRLAGEGEPPER